MSELSKAIDDELAHRYSIWFADGREPHHCVPRPTGDGREACKICGAITQERRSCGICRQRAMKGHR